MANYLDDIVISKEMLMPHCVVIVALPPVQALDVIGPLDAFQAANLCCEAVGKGRPYELRLASPRAAPVSTSAGVSLVAECDMFDECLKPDTVLIAGGPGPRHAVSDIELIAGLRSLCERSRRVGSICTGAFPLAATGLLEGGRATTHWAYFDEFAAQFPTIELDRDALFVDSGPCHTSAGITAGIDYSLALIESDLGRAVALDVARSLVVFLKRPGGQAQFSAHLEAQLNSIDGDRFGRLTRWIEQNLASDITVERMAEQLSMSSRNFARRFVEKMNMSPARYVDSVRVDAARRLLTDTELSLSRIAERCGFGSAEVMRQAFKRHINTTPGDFRARFRSVRSSAAASRPGPEI